MSRDFKIIRIEDFEDYFRVKLQFIDNNEMMGISFKRNKGFEDIENGEPKFINEIRNRLIKKEDKNNLTKIKKNYENKIIKGVK